MTSDEPYELDARESAAYNARLEALSIPELQALTRDPEAMQQLAREAQLQVALEDADLDTLLRLNADLDTSLSGPLFTESEWALIYRQPQTRHLAGNPAERAKFEHVMRSDPAGVRELKGALADIQSERKSALDPIGKPWLIWTIVGLVLCVIVLALNQN